MLLVSGLLLGLALSVVTGGDWRRLQELTLRWAPLLVLGFAIRLVGSAVALPLWFYCAGLALIVAVCLRNVRLPGAALVGIGTAANLLVIVLNRGMPVTQTIPGQADAIVEFHSLHIPLTDSTILPWLADILPVAPLKAIYSPGDAVIAVGGFVLAFVATRR